MRKSIILSSLAFGALSAVVAGPASADPKSDETIPVTCNNGQSYEVVVAGNGEFTPAHIVGGTGTFVPVAFGEFTGTVTSSTGQVLETFTEAGSAKGNSGKNRTLLTCTYSFSEVSDGSDGFPAGAVFTGGGTVTGFLTPAN